MPQMKPMNWMILFIITNLIILFMNINNYLNYNIKINKNNNKNKNNIMNNWKW